MLAEWVSANYVSCIFQNDPQGYKRKAFIRGSFATSFTCIFGSRSKLVFNKDNKCNSIPCCVSFTSKVVIPYNSVGAAVVTGCKWNHQHSLWQRSTWLLNCFFGTRVFQGLSSVSPWTGLRQWGSGLRHVLGERQADIITCLRSELYRTQVTAFSWLLTLLLISLCIASNASWLLHEMKRRLWASSKWKRHLKSWILGNEQAILWMDSWCWTSQSLKTWMKSDKNHINMSTIILIFLCQLFFSAPPQPQETIVSSTALTLVALLSQHILFCIQLPV